MRPNIDPSARGEAGSTATPPLHLPTTLPEPELEAEPEVEPELDPRPNPEAEAVTYLL